MNFNPSPKAKKDRRDSWNKPLAEVLAAPKPAPDARVDIWLKRLEDVLKGSRA